MNKQSKSVAIFLSAVPISYLLWLVMIGTFALHELLIGLVATAFATTGLWVVDFKYPARFHPKLSELLAIWRLPWYLLSGAWAVWLTAAKDLLGIERAESVFRLAEFNAGQEDNPHDIARRVLAVGYTSATPTSVVLGINPRQQKMLFHQLKRSTVQKMTKALGAR
ncbi:MAG TPA: hypothetical protein VFQ00_00165 [Terriglobales bacterium]|nr:hypothetical protein [Terriglobales bacterium]